MMASVGMFTKLKSLESDLLNSAICYFMRAPKLGVQATTRVLISIGFKLGRINDKIKSFRLYKKKRKALKAIRTLILIPIQRDTITSYYAYYILIKVILMI